MKRFSLVLIKPSHYDDDGYVIQWLRSAIPSNTLAVLNGLVLESQNRRVLDDRRLDPPVRQIAMRPEFSAIRASKSSAAALASTAFRALS